jgi:uncharacterized membrane protein
MISSSHFHPMLVHFPIALVTFGFIAELAFLIFKNDIWLLKSGFYLLIIGTIATLFSLLTGVFFTTKMAGAAGEIKEIHELLAWITLSLLIGTSFLQIYISNQNKKNANLKWLAFGLYGMAAISVSLTGFYGGTLVYNYMMPL